MLAMSVEQQMDRCMSIAIVELALLADSCADLRHPRRSCSQDSASSACHEACPLCGHRHDACHAYPSPHACPCLDGSSSLMNAKHRFCRVYTCLAMSSCSCKVDAKIGNDKNITYERCCSTLRDRQHHNKAVMSSDDDDAPVLGTIEQKHTLY